MENQVLKTIKSRRSIRKYLPNQITDQELEQILEAGTFAPSGHNSQSWHFTVIQNQEVIQHICQKTKEEMAKSEVEWVKKMGNNPNYNLVHGAPTLIVVSGNQEAYSPLADCSAAIQNMLLAAESLNIGSLWIGLIEYYFKLEESQQVLELPQGYKPYFGVCLGYKAIDKPINPLARKEGVIKYIR